MNKNNKIIYFFLIIFFGGFLIFNFSLAQDVDHVVISDIQIGGETVYDEFIRLYNPTEDIVDLNGWDLRRKTKTGTESNILNNMEGVITAKGFFLIIPRANCGDSKDENCYQGTEVSSDEYTTNSFLAKDNTVLLYDLDGSVIDIVGWGEAGDFEGEAINVNPNNGQNFVRKINGGIIRDTDHNQDDFAQDSTVQDGEINVKEDAIALENEIVNDGNLAQPDSTQENGVNDIKDSYSIPEIIITEFLPNPEDSDRDNEFIELYNKGEKDVDLTGWTLEDKKGKIKVFTIPEKNIIKAKSYKVFYSDETRIALNNSGDGVVLKDDRENIVSETLVSNSAKEDQSFSLDKDDNWVWTLRPTAGRENIIEVEENDEINFDEKTENKIDIIEEDNSQKNDEIENLEIENEFDYSDQIVISEIYPNPIGNDNRQGSYEWIEIYNSSNREVNLRGWQIDDILNKGSRLYLITEDIIIKSRNFIVFKNNQTKIILNNSGDEINLLWPDGEVVDNVKYEKAKEGFSYGWISEGVWSWSENITPGKENEVQDVGDKNEIKKEEVEYLGIEEPENQNNLIENNYIDAQIKDLESFVKYTRVRISGIVSTPPGIFASEILYLSENGAGVQIFYKEGKYPKIQVGDLIEATGLVSKVGGEKRILLVDAKDIKIISRDNYVEPQVVLTGDVGPANEGQLIAVEGKISEIKKDVFFVDDGSGEVKIYIKPQTNIQKNDFQKGDWMVIVGQVSRTSLGYRILPRFQNDIKRGLVSGIANMVEASSDFSAEKKVLQENKKFPFFTLLAMMGTLIFFDWGRMKRKKLKYKNL
ncbi:lamin tail domain-containing protein [Candidatus Parcubacteria bacterium]|nr:lamin tail domain-containing protein [Candidatus Parcubacteria bacterium]